MTRLWARPGPGPGSRRGGEPRGGTPGAAVHAGRAAPVLLSLAGAVLALVAVLMLVDVRTDMAEFLPRGSTPAARLVFDEARSGAATGLVLVGIEGAPQAELARLARAVQAALPGTGLFQLVAGGQVDPADQAVLFDHRYALSPAVDAGAFRTEALHAGMEALLRQLRGSAAPLAVQFGLPDPTGAFLPMLRAWAGETTARSIDGAWFDAAGDRALLLARTRAGGMDIPGQEAALGAIVAAFREAGPGGARLLLSGPAVFARDAARSIRADVERISVVSTLLVLALLWWRFRSVLVLAAVAVPVVLGVAAAALVVQAAFGTVHGVALGFGATMLGVCVDYPVLMIGHRKRGEAAAGTRRRIGRAFALAVACAALGLAPMALSAFPGLAQLGVFAACGLVACAVLTWVLLPWLVVRADLAPVAAGDLGWVGRVERWRRHRGWVAVPAAAAALLLGVRGVAWEGDLQALSPVPAASLALDHELRGQLGAAEPGQMLLVTGASAEEVLRRQEALHGRLDGLVAAGSLGGYSDAASLLPSRAVQAARLASLPDAATLAGRVEAARAGTPFRPAAFQPFLDAVERARLAGPVRLEDLAGTLPGARLAAMLLPRGAGWVGPVLLRGAAPAAEALDGPGVSYLDMRRDLAVQLGAYTTGAMRVLGGSLVLIVLVLLAGLRDWRRAARVLGAVAAALLVTVAALGAAGVRLSPVHLVALQLVAGVGLDYALFFARRQLDLEERARTLRTLVTCNAMTLLTFGLLAACQTPLLRDIGVTVAAGAVLAMGFAFMLAGRAEGEKE